MGQSMLELYCTSDMRTVFATQDQMVTVYTAVILSVSQLMQTRNLHVLQFDDILHATKAAQALVEQAHKEIELSGIQPVLSLAALDAQIPLSMLRLPSDPSSVSPLPSPQRQGSTGDPQNSLHALQGLTGCLRSPNTAARKELRTVSWKSQQLEQAIQDVCAAEQGTSRKSEGASRPPSGSLSKESSSSLNKPPARPLRRTGSRIISPFAAASSSHPSPL